MNRIGSHLVTAATVVVATGVFAVVLHTLVSDTALSDRRAIGLALAQGAAILLASRIPAVALVSSLGAVALGTIWVDADLWVDALINSYLVVLGALGLRSSVRAAAGYWCATVAVGVVLAIGLRPPDAVPGVLAAAALSGLVLIAGSALHGVDSARRALRRERESTRREHEHAVVLAERAKIARELHDVVAHHMTVIAIQAEAARYRAPETVPDTLAAIRDSAVTALGEMRHILGALRSDDSGVLPQPTLADLDRLVEAVRATGTEVDLLRTGDGPELPPGVELSAYRIIQEATSNAVRHAPGTRITVRVTLSEDAVRIEVANDFAGAASGAGVGLIGMRERVAILGGTVTAGPTGEGVYRVDARLPIQVAG